MMVLFLSPVVVQAETLCTCFCKTDKGAQQPLDQKVTLDKCESLCSGTEFLTCAQTAGGFPGNNALCFSAADCAKVKGKLSPQQAPECPSSMTYCFPESQAVKAKLNVKIGKMETVEDLGTYVSTAYSWMLGAAAVFAVIFIMIGGLEWVLSAGGATSVTKAKDRIKNGIIGLLLLISVSLILQTVNPELLKLQVARPSLLRQIVLAGNSCEKLVKEGYIIETEKNAKLECGTTAVIKTDPKGNMVADGLTCQYTSCANGWAACIGVATNAKCVECNSVSAGNPSSPAQPSPAVCSMLEIKKYAKNATTGKEWFWYGNSCTFVKGGLAGVAELQLSSDVTISNDSCLDSRVDCSQITDCDAYDKVKSYVYDKNKTLVWTLFGDFAKTQFSLMCSSDPCGVGGSKGCEWGQILGCSNR